MSSRRVTLRRSTCAGGGGHGRRRSPRISSLDVCKSEPDSASAHKLKRRRPLSPATTTRNRIKRKRHQLHSHASSTEDAPQVQDGTLCKHEAINCGKASIIPEKKVLEHILDTLQRRDTYEIFAEPVDPDEVVDYYEIIKEPMDFGTMRAKLHEGMYETLEQFKHDVFLITENAMHFNSSSTIYFRQGRAIHELSKTVFHVLETDSENFELEFLGTRRRSARRAHIEAKDCRLSAESKPILTSNASPKDKPCPVVASVLERNSRGTPKSATVASRSNTRNNHNLFLGARDGRRTTNIETDRRCTYRRHQECSFHNNNNILDSKPLLTNEEDFNYRESLLLFVKDLGPTAHMIATRKIQGLQENPIWVQTRNYQENAPHARNLSSSQIMDAIYSNMSLKFTDSISGTIELSKDEEHREAYSKGRTSSHGGASDKKRLECSESPSLPTGINVLGAPRRSRLLQNHKGTELFLGASDTSARDLNSSIFSKTNSNGKCTSLMVKAGRLDENVRSVILALEHSHANSSDTKLRNKKSCTSSRSFSQNRASQVNGTRNSSCTNNQIMPMPATEEKKRGSSSRHDETRSLLKQPIKIPPTVSGFTFDMNFLKTKLNQMKAVDQEKELNKQARYGISVDGKKGFTLEQRSWSYREGILNKSSTQSFPNKESSHNLDNQLALQL